MSLFWRAPAHQPGACIVVPIGDDAALRAALMALLADPDGAAAMGERAHRFMAAALQRRSNSWSCSVSALPPVVIPSGPLLQERLFSQKVAGAT